MVRPLKDYLDAHEYVNRHMKIGLKKSPKPKSLWELVTATRSRRTNHLLLTIGLRMTKYYEFSLNRLDLRSLHTKKLKVSAATEHSGFCSLKNKFDF